MPAERGEVFLILATAGSGRCLNVPAMPSFFAGNFSLDRPPVTDRKSRRVAGAFNSRVLRIFYIRWTQSVQMLTKSDISGTQVPLPATTVGFDPGFIRSGTGELVFQGFHVVERLNPVRDGRLEASALSPGWENWGRVKPEMGGWFWTL